MRTPAVCRTSGGDHRPGDVETVGTFGDVQESDCLDCDQPIVRHFDGDEDGPLGWRRWTLRAPARVIPADAARAVGRFQPEGPSGYRASNVEDAPLRATRAEAVADYVAAL
jgi:hypothetical protein